MQRLFGRLLRITAYLAVKSCTTVYSPSLRSGLDSAPLTRQTAR